MTFDFTTLTFFDFNIYFLSSAVFYSYNNSYVQNDFLEKATFNTYVKK